MEHVEKWAGWRGGVSLDASKPLSRRTGTHQKGPLDHKAPDLGEVDDHRTRCDAQHCESCVPRLVSSESGLGAGGGYFKKSWVVSYSFNMFAGYRHAMKTHVYSTAYTDKMA